MKVRRPAGGERDRHLGMRTLVRRYRQSASRPREAITPFGTAPSGTVSYRHYSRIMASSVDVSSVAILVGRRPPEVQIIELLPRP